MNLLCKILMVCLAGAALSACASEPSVEGHALPSDATISAFIEHDRQLVASRKAPAELVSVDAQIGQSLKDAKRAAALNDMAAIKAMDPKVRALLDRRKVLVGTNATVPTNGDPAYAQMLYWDQNAVAHSAADPIILKYDAQMANLKPGSPAYERLERLKLAADQKLNRTVTAASQRMGQPNPCQGPMGENICAAPAPSYDAGPTEAEKQWQADQDYRRQQEINGNQ